VVMFQDSQVFMWLYSRVAKCSCGYIPEYPSVHVVMFAGSQVFTWLYSRVAKYSCGYVPG